MERRPLGAEGTLVSKLSLGAMTFGEGMPPITTVDEPLARRIVATALDRGVNLIDTADAYAGGASEEIVGAAIRARRDDVLVATKVGFGAPGPGALSYANVIAAARPVCGGWAPTTSTCTSCTGPTAARPSRRRSARSTTS